MSVYLWFSLSWEAYLLHPFPCPTHLSNLLILVELIMGESPTLCLAERQTSRVGPMWPQLIFFPMFSGFSHCFTSHISSHLDSFPCFLSFVRKLIEILPKQDLTNPFPSAIASTGKYCLFFCCICTWFQAKSLQPPDGQFLTLLTAGSNSLTADPLVPSLLLHKTDNCQTVKKILGEEYET